MERRRGCRLGRPRSVALVAVAAAATAGTSIASTLTADPERWHALRDAGAACVLLGAWLILWRRAADEGPGESSERPVWLRFAGALGAVTLGVVTHLAVGVGTSATVGALAAAAFGISASVAFPLIYHGLIRWNRYRGLIADPSDWLNGLCAVLVVVAGAGLAVSWHGGGLSRLPWWLLQISLFQIAASFVVLGTTCTIASLSGLQRDVRIWSVGAAVTIVGVSEAVYLGSGANENAECWPLIGWMAAAVLLACGTLAAPAAARARQATNQAPTIGALLVLLAGVAVLVANSVRVAQLEPGTFDRRWGWVEYAPTIFAVLAILGVSIRLGFMIRDLTLLAQTRLEAHTDGLTGVANRRALMARLEELVAQRGPVSLLVADLDRFKEVNDRYGHPAGDALLVEVATRFGALVPTGGLLARLGGDEFALLLQQGELDAAELAEQLTEVAASIVTVADHPVHIGASIGVAAGGGGIDSEELLRRADAAMYRAKVSGGGVGRYEGEIDRIARERANRVEELRSALDPVAPQRREQFLVHYQPQLDLRSGEVTGVEALVRWQHPDHGLLAPAEFIDLIEQHGLMAQLTEHVLWQAARQAARWEQDGRPLRVAVNLSTSLLAGPDLLILLDDVLEVTSLDPRLLVLEVTETTLMADARRGLETALAVAARGVGLSIDDYGTGYSSLAYLSDLPARELKLDRSFVIRLLVDERTAAIVAATVELAHSLDLRLVAEGVEDEATLDALRLLGCDGSQGYLHSRPLPLDALEPWLAARRTPRVPTPRRGGAGRGPARGRVDADQGNGQPFIRHGATP